MLQKPNLQLPRPTAIDLRPWKQSTPTQVVPAPKPPEDEPTKSVLDRRMFGDTTEGRIRNLLSRR